MSWNPGRRAASGCCAASADTPHQIQHLTEAGRKKAREKRALVITKANSRSTVHRSAYLDYIGVKSFDAAGNVNGERRFIGLFATTAYAGSVRDIPVVREKVAAVLSDAGFPPDSHSGKDLLGILETYPRDELFQIEIPDLAAIATGIQRLQERRRTRLFLRPDIYGRFMSALVYLPRDRYTTNVRLRIEQELRETFDAVSIDYEARMTESALARLFFRIRLPEERRRQQRQHRRPREAAGPGGPLVERRHRRGPACPRRRRRRIKEDGAKELAAVWAEAFPASYRVDYEVEDALEDIARFEKYGAAAERAGEAVKEQPGVHVYLPEGAGATLEEDARVKLYMLEPKSLSQILPYFHNLGLEVLDERPFEIETADQPGLLPLRPRPEVPGRRGPAQDRAAARGLLRRRGVRCSGIGQLRPAGAARGNALAPGRRAARLRQVHAADGQHQLLRLPGRHAAGQPRCQPRAQRPVRGPLRSRRSTRTQRRLQAGRGPRRTGRGDRTGRDPRRRPGAAHLQEPDPGDAADQLLPEQAAPELQAEPVRASRACRSRGPCSRSGSTRPGSRVCTCASARWPAAGCAGPTAARTSARRSSAWSRPRRSRTP